MKICNEKEQAEQGKIFERKGAPEGRLELSSMFKEINRLRNGIKGVIT